MQNIKQCKIYCAYIYQVLVMAYIYYNQYLEYQIDACVTVETINTAANSELVTLYFYPSSESKNRVINNSCFYKQNKALPRLCKLFNLKTTSIFCIDDVRVKVSTFKKVTQLFGYKIFHRYIIRLNFCLFEDILDC